jgi:hypothetical protein
MSQMNLDSLATQGRLPWSPTPDARDLDVWDLYEHPRVGTFATSAYTVLFTVVGRLEGRLSVWAYGCLEPGEAQDIVDVAFESPEEMADFVEETLARRRLVFALADDLVIRSWAVAEAEGPVYEMATEFLDQVLAQTRIGEDASVRFRAKLAEVDVATDDLIDALPSSLICLVFLG